MKYIVCQECGNESAVMIGGQGNKKWPWLWECSDCDHIWRSNDNEPEEDDGN